MTSACLAPDLLTAPPESIAVIALAADDIERAALFYERAFGLRRAPDRAENDGSLTLQTPDQPTRDVLRLELARGEFSRVMLASMTKAGLAQATFYVDDVAQNYWRLRDLGVAFAAAPMRADALRMTAVFHDGHGNLIRLNEL